MIQIFPHSFLSMMTTVIVHLYFLFKRKIIKTSLWYYPYKSHQPTIYFIIRTGFLTWEQLTLYLQDIRKHSEFAKIIIIGRDIDYEFLLKNHYRVFGVIDTSERKSPLFIWKQVCFYLDGIYGKRTAF